MAKELPYFRFTVQEWQNGDISLERYELQGLFISICGFYWLQDCDCTLALLQKKFSNATLELKELIDLGIIKHENRHDKIKIDFLMKQYDLLSEKRKLRQAAGSKGGNAKAMLKQKGSYKDNNNNKDKDKDIPEFNFKKSLLELEVELNVVETFLEVRKKKKAVNSELAFNDIKKQITKSGLTPNEAIKLASVKSWSGFNARWVKDEDRATPLPVKREIIIW